ncbi:fumarylacetoacetate hydrolase family protein [Paracoccus tegillarcae]|uniref:Fumarylacetoacetate hydrolase n=1 Tax=Paracoccus tegillarcae TaxID=1529068 RepID=A0A2K9EGL9_9RHOB|nr:fumarylacetoacetate hydrolase family protein [Paracoccus tegillarcae]AUH33489.1 fumarylacetoacetate hydrolase [Paracoccus tegillarcae]
MTHAISQPALTLDGADFPVRRIFCIGRNYADHAAEMGNEVDREKPFFFTKSAHALTAPGDVPYPPGTEDLHHEVELVLAIGTELDDASPEQAAAAIVGRAVGLDMTRRDLQGEAKDKRRPWDAAKDFDHSAIIAPLSSAAAGPGIRLSVNGAVRQDGALEQMIFSEAEIVAFLSSLYTLMPGDLIMTGTPAGVGAVTRGDSLHAEIDGLPVLDARIV